MYCGVRDNCPFRHIVEAPAAQAQHADLRLWHGTLEKKEHQGGVVHVVDSPEKGWSQQRFWLWMPVPLLTRILQDLTQP